MKIRKSQNKELDQIIKLWKKYKEFEEKFVNLKKQSYIKKRKEAEENMRKYFKRCIKDNEAEIFVAEEKGEIVGFMLISKSKGDDIHKFDFYGEMNYAYIKPEFRGQGVASKFFKKAKKWFRENEIQYLKLDVNIKNKKARNIYEKWGFEAYEIGMWKSLK